MPTEIITETCPAPQCNQEEIMAELEAELEKE
jgi:hypothetical protein